MGKKPVKFAIGLSALLICSCTVGPNYVPPVTVVPNQYKEALIKPPKGWKVASPRDDQNRGPWWEIFHNDELCALENQLNSANQNIALALAQYEQSVALIAEARASFFPVISGFLSYTRQKPPNSTFNTISGTGVGGAGSAAGQTSGTGSGTGSKGSNASNASKNLKPFSTYLVNFNASWEPDLWGGVRRIVESYTDTSQSTAAQLASVRLSMQSLLAQDYFQLRTLDRVQQVLDNAVAAYQRLLKITQYRLQAGTASQTDVAAAVTQLKVAQAAAIDNGVNRALFEHAIAVLVGAPPSIFTLKPKIVKMDPPTIPTQIPSELLERRPDIAQAERQVASANAQIGVAISAFFPTLPLSASTGFQSNKLNLLFSGPSSFWLIGAKLMETFYEGGLRRAQVAAARAIYRQNVATYREVVLGAFQNVEDNLATLRILKSEAAVESQAVTASKHSVRFQVHDYKSGTSDITSVLVAQNSTYSIEQTNELIKGRQMVATVTLIASLGGCWDR